jgi:chitin disaccharide deacetylase
MDYSRISRSWRKIRQIVKITFSDPIQTRLGYSDKAKLMIIHADDLGMSSSENAASIIAMEKGVINSASLMVPCPRFREIVVYSKANPQADIGIHLTITSEWNSYKWGPILPPHQVASLVDAKGFFFESIAVLLRNFKSDEVEKEFRAQIILALKSGIDVTHLDSHMLAAFSHPIIREIYIKLGREFKLPVLLNNEIPIPNFDSKKDIIIDRLYHARPEDYQIGFSSYYRNILESIKPGLNCILVHLAFDDKEMQNITNNQFSFGSEWRQADYDFFTSIECRQLIDDKNIQLITWREIRDKLIRLD